MFQRFATPLIVLVTIAFLGVVAVPIVEDPIRWALGEAGGRGPFVFWSSWVRAEMWVEGAAVPPTGYPVLPTIPDIQSPTFFGLFSLLSRLTGTGPAGAALAWNGTILGWLLIGIIGTVALVRRLNPRASAISLGVAIVAIPASLGWSGAIVAGDVADLPALLLPAHFALLHRWVGKERDPLSGVGATLLLCGAVLCRWQMSFFVLAMCLPLAVVIGRRLQNRADLLRWGIVLLPGFLIGIWHIWAAAGATMPAPEIGVAALRAPLWSLLAADAAPIVGPWLLSLPAVGMMVLVLVATVEHPLDSVGWWLCATWGVLLAGGTSATPYIAPGRRMADLFPVLQGITDWSMVVPLIAIPFGVLAAKGAAALKQRHIGGVAIALALAALADQSHHLIGMHTDDRRFEVRPTRVATIAFENVAPGAVLDLPFAPAHSPIRAQALLDQRMHRRAISIGAPTQGDGAMDQSYLARIALRMQVDPGTLPSPETPLEPKEFLCAVADIDNLIALGFSSVSFRGRPYPANPTWQTLSLVLGTPAFRDRSLTVWSLHQASHPDPPEACSLPPIPRSFTPDLGIYPDGGGRPSSPR